MLTGVQQENVEGNETGRKHPELLTIGVRSEWLDSVFKQPACISAYSTSVPKHACNLASTSQELEARFKDRQCYSELIQPPHMLLLSNGGSCKQVWHGCTKRMPNKQGRRKWHVCAWQAAQPACMGFR
jgi:hypothetical protein